MLKPILPLPRLLVAFVLLFAVACTPQLPGVAGTDTVLPSFEPTQAPTAGVLAPILEPAPAHGSKPVADRDPRSKGDPNAPITIIMYTDYQCPFCASFVQETKPLIEDNYIKTGKAYFVVRDYPLTSIHPGAMLAATFANCAIDQGGFWDLHDRLYAEQGYWGYGDTTDEQTFLDYAKELKLDVSKLQDCVHKNLAIKRAIQADMQEAEYNGIRGTPFFVIMGSMGQDTQIRGAVAYGVWRKTLDRLLAQVQK